MNPKVDKYLNNAPKWQNELEKLREIIQSCQLVEEFKWGSPCYSFNGNNVVGIRGFKEHFAIWYYKGVLLKDPYKILIASGENTQALRQIRLKSMSELINIEKQIREYIFEAIEVEKTGTKVDYNKNKELEYAMEFQSKLDEIPALKTAFSELTPGRQREYCRYFSEPKQAKTRESRVEKCIPIILDGRGLNDKYKC